MSIIIIISEHIVLHPAVVVEELGGGEDCRAQDGPGPGHHHVSIIQNFIN